MTSLENKPKSPSFFSSAAAVVGTIAKHVLWRGFFWGGVGFLVGAVAAVLSFVIGVYALGRGAEILTFALVVPVALIFLGAAVFFMHGLQRGVARAALVLEKQYGLVRYVVRRVTGLLEAKLGAVVKDVPVAEFGRRLQEAVQQYLKSDDAVEGQGFTAWILRKVKRLIAKRLQPYLLLAYREQEEAGVSKEGLSLEKLGENVADQLSGRIGKMVMSPLNKQLVIFMFLYVVLAGGWWYWLFLLLKLFIRTTPSS